jgi:glutamate/aspartate transport system permease protein
MTYSWDWSILFQPSATGEGLYGLMLVEGAGWTITISILSWVLALITGTIVGALRFGCAGPVSYTLALYVHCFRNIPLLIQLLLWYYLFPELLPHSPELWLKQMDPLANQFLSVILCLTLYTAAGVAEQVKAGLAALPEGQLASARALGLETVDCYRLVLLPQAFRMIIPPLTSDFMNVFKNSSVALVIGFMELTGQSRQVGEFSGQPLESFAAATLIYMLITLAVVKGMNIIHDRFAVQSSGCKGPRDF